MISLDLPDRSCVFYITHPSTWSSGNVREFFSPWNLLSHDRVDLTTHAVAVSLKKDTVETSKQFQILHLIFFFSLSFYSSVNKILCK